MIPDDVHLQIGSLLFEGIDQIDLTGPFEVLSQMPNATHQVYGRTADPIRDVNGLRLTPDATLADAPRLDVLHVPGGHGQEALMDDEEILGWIRAQAANARAVLSAAGIDAALRLVASLRGEHAAQRIQLDIAYAPEPPFDSGTPAAAPPAVLAEARAAVAPITADRQASRRTPGSRLSRNRRRYHDPRTQRRHAMTKMSALADRNRHYAEEGSWLQTPRLPFLPHQGLYVVTCIDPRVDPALFLELQFAEAIVARTVGGRVTPAVIQDLAYIGYLVEAKAPEGPYFEAAIVHHTDCGSGLLADQPLRHGFAQRTGYDEDELAKLPVLDPAATVHADVQRLLTDPRISPRITVSGHVYDVHTGLMSTVLDAASPLTSNVEGATR